MTRVCDKTHTHRLVLMSCKELHGQIAPDLSLSSSWVSAELRGNDRGEKMERDRGRARDERVREKAADLCLGDS